MTKTIKITGMSCEHCVRAVEKALGSIESVLTVEVFLDEGKAVVYSSGVISDDTLTLAIEDAGFEMDSIE